LRNFAYFILKSILCGLLTWPTLSYTQNVNARTQGLLHAYDSLVYSKTSYKAIDILLYETKKTEDGGDLSPTEKQLLLVKKKKAENFLRVSKGLDQCLTNPDSVRHLKDRVREAAGRAQIENFCGNKNTIAETAKLSHEIVTAQFAQSLLDQSRQNAFLTYLDVSARFDTNLRSIDVVNKYCSETSSCDSVKKNGLQALASQYLAAMPSKGESVSNESLASRLTQKLTDLKNGSAEMPTSGENLLIYTSTIQDKFRKNNKVQAVDVMAAQLEIKAAIGEQVKMLTAMATAKNPTSLRANIKRLIKSNPAAVGQVLLQNPDFVSMVCEMIREIEENDDSDARWDKAFMWGGVIVGGALLVTGVFSWAGAGVLAAAGAAATTIAAINTVATVSLVGGGVVGVTQGAYYGNKAYKSYQSYQDIENALLTSNGDKQSLKDKEKQLSLFKESVVQASLSTALGSLDLGPLAQLAKAGKITEVTQVLRNITSDSALTSLFEKVQKLTSKENVVDFLKYLSNLPKDKASQLLASMKTWSPKKLVEFMANLKNATVDGTKKYLREVKESPYYSRVIWKEHDQTVSRNPFKNPSGWAFNPIATLRNSSKEFTLPASTLTMVAAFDMPSEYLKSKVNDQNWEKANKVATTLPGGGFALEYAKQGIIGVADISKAILAQDRELEVWAKTTSSKNLPRVSDMIKNKILTEAEAKEFNELCRQAFAEATSSTDPNISKTAVLEQKLWDKITNTPTFKNKPQQDLEVMMTAFWPQVKIDKHTDIELTRMLTQKDNANISAVQGKSLANIRSMVASDGIDLPTAHFLTAKTLDVPNEIIKKAALAKTILPVEKIATANRPDLPIAYEELKFKTAGTKKSLKNEMDRWSVLISDPRFASLEEQWKQGKITDVQALETQQLMIKGLEQIEPYMNQGKKLRDSDVQDILGTNPKKGLNPLFAEPLMKLENIRTSKKLSNDASKKCDKSVVNLWINYHKIQSTWSSANLTESQFTEKKKALDQLTLNTEQELLNRCSQ
jgi:hypothetical protein